MQDHLIIRVLIDSFHYAMQATFGFFLMKNSKPKLLFSFLTEQLIL